MQSSLGKAEDLETPGRARQPVPHTAPKLVNQYFNSFFLKLRLFNFSSGINAIL